MQLIVIGEKEGRPTKLDEAMAAKICEGLSYGLNDQQTADLVGIGIATLYRWLGDESFNARVAQAKAQRQLVRLKRIENGDVGWQGSAWLQERSDPQMWGRHLLFQRAEGDEKNITKASLVDTLANYHALKNGKAKEQPQEAIREVPSGDSEQS